MSSFDTKFEPQWSRAPFQSIHVDLQTSMLTRCLLKATLRDGCLPQERMSLFALSRSDSLQMQ